MAKSDSTRKPPSKVWLVFDSKSRLIDWANHRLGIAKSDEQAHQYTPLQKPRRCMWDDSDGFDYTYCPNCGGKIVRKAR